MQDDLNTAEAVGYVFGLVRLANRMLEDKTFRKSEAGKEIMQEMLGMLENWGDALGVFQRFGEEFLEQLKLMRCNRLDIDPQAVQEMVLKRQQARKDKDFETADQIREELAAKGIEVMDTPAGPRWDFA